MLSSFEQLQYWYRLRTYTVYCTVTMVTWSSTFHITRNFKNWDFVFKLLSLERITATSKSYILWSLGFVQVFSVNSRLWLPAPKLSSLIFTFHSVVNLVQSWEKLLCSDIWSHCLQSQRAGHLQCSFTTSGSLSLSSSMPNQNLSTNFT